MSLRQNVITGEQGAGTPEHVDQLTVRANPLSHQTGTSEVGSSFIRSAATLQGKRFTPIRYIVPGYITEGCTLLAGRPKLGKSWMVLEIGLAVAAGQACLGHAPCEQGSVLYLALEDNERRLQNRIQKIVGTNYEHWPEAFEYATEWRRSNEGGLDAIADWIKSRPNPRLIVVDVLAMFKPVRGDKETLYEADYASIKGLQKLAGRYNLAIVVVHHTRKSGSEVDPFEKVSGTLGLSGAADTALVLDRDGSGATLYGRGRDIQELEMAIKFDKLSCRWTIQGTTSEVRQTNERKALLDLLKVATRPLTIKELSEALEAVQNNCKQLLFKLAKSGEVIRVGRKGHYVHVDRTDLSPPSKLDNRDNPNNQPPSCHE